MFPLVFRNGHLFVEVDSLLWLIDTGAPSSFGSVSDLSLLDHQFHIDNSYVGLTAATLSQSVNMDCTGLLGADVLNQFDFLFDPQNEKVDISIQELEHPGDVITFEEFMGIPIIVTQINGVACRMFFDTGAQISYFQDTSLSQYPSAGEMTDFYPGVGEFQIETFHVDVSLGSLDLTLHCGELPGELGATLMMAGTVGIIGNEIMADRLTGYFPRRRMLVL